MTIELSGSSKVVPNAERESGLIFLKLTFGYFYGNVSELGDDSLCPRKSSLFFLTNSWMTLESDCLEIGLDEWKSAPPFGASGA